MKKSNPVLYGNLAANGIPALKDAAFRAWGAIPTNVIAHYNSYLLNVRASGSFGPIEKHPYIDTYKSDFDLKRKFLLLGTFPPSTYFNNIPALAPNLSNPNVGINTPLDYYYGNTKELWDYLLGLLDGAITVINIQLNLNTNQIAISDVFSFIQRKKMKDSSDTNLYNITVNCDLVKVFDTKSEIETILFTSGSLANFLSNTTSTLTGFRWILEECFINGLENFEVSGTKDGAGPYYKINQEGINAAVNQQAGGIIWWLKKGKRKIRVINLPSPSGGANMRMFGTSFFLKWVNYMAIQNALTLPTPIQQQAIKSTYLTLYPQVFNTPYTKSYRRSVYEMVLNGTIHLI
jgi:hypothetical protein